MVIGAERDLIDERRSPEYILELPLIEAQLLRSNIVQKNLCVISTIGNALIIHINV
jgi:hypothetical protein